MAPRPPGPGPSPLNLTPSPAELACVGCMGCVLVCEQMPQAVLVSPQRSQAEAQRKETRCPHPATGSLHFPACKRLPRGKTPLLSVVCSCVLASSFPPPSPLGFDGSWSVTSCPEPSMVCACHSAQDGRAVCDRAACGPPRPPSRSRRGWFPTRSDSTRTACQLVTGSPSRDRECLSGSRPPP